METLLTNAAGRAARYLKEQETGRVYPLPEALEGLDWFTQPLQENPIVPEQVLAELDEHGSPGTLASPDRRLGSECWNGGGLAHWGSPGAGLPRLAA